MCETKKLAKTKVVALTEAINRLSENLEKVFTAPTTLTMPKMEPQELPERSR